MLNQRLALLIAASLVALVLLSASPLRQSVLPGFEGLNAGVEGLTVPSGFTRIDAQPPFPYKWVSSDPKTVVLEKADYLGQNAQVRVEVGNPAQKYDPFVTGAKIHYWVKESAVLYREIEGEVKVSTMSLTVSAVNVGGVDGWFSGEKIWMGLTAVAWNRAVQKTGADYGTAWEAPLAVVVEGYSVRDQGEHWKVEPSEQGRWVTLYDSTSQVGTVSDLGLQSGGDLNSTLTGQASPDSRLKRTAFFAVTLTDFGTTDHVIWSSSPVVDYTLKIYSLQIGKYTYTSPDKTPWAQRQTESFDVTAPLTDWLSNPWNLLGVGSFGLLLVFGLAALVLFWFFGGPKRLRG